MVMSYTQMSTATQDLSAEEKRTLLKKLLQQKAQERTYPLSAAQQRFWFLDQLDPGNPAYNVVYAVRLTGPLDTVALERSVNEIVRRHAILRTIFVAHNGQTVQKITPHQLFPLTIETLPPLVDVERDAAAQHIAREEAGWHFDLSRGPLYRMRLVQMQADEHIGFVTMHHTVADGVSMDLFVRELGVLYAAYTANQPSPLPDLSWQYVDFVNWQREQMAQDQLQQQLSYWKGKLAGELPAMQLPADFPRPPFRTAQGATHYHDLSAELSEALKALGQQTGCTLFVTLLAAFKTFLHRICGQDDLLVGTPVSGRHLSQTNPLIGLFLNTVVLRTTVDGKLPFRQWLAQVRETTLEALAHQELPFARLVDELQPERDPSRSPLFQVMFVARPPRRKAQQVAGLTFQALETDSGASLVDLSLMYWETETGIRLAFEYSTELFAAATVHRLAQHFHTLLQAIITDPDQTLATLPLLTTVERHELLTGWNDTARPYDHTTCIHTLFEQQTARTPDAAALVAGQETLTYAQLNERAEQLAVHLQHLGVGGGTLVGVCLRRSAHLVIALLATLKAGAAYVPLDPDYPASRLAYMLDDSQATVLLTQRDLLDSLPSFTGPVVCLDGSLPGHEAARPRQLSDAQNLAYLIYTSGSTGRPKGVTITHRNAVAMLAWASELFPSDELAGTLAVTSICFDLSIYELFLPLAQGGTVILAQDALHLLTLPQRNQVTLINTVPSAMAELVRARAIPETVQTINLAGEPLKRVLVDQIYTASNIARVYNLYGPSEDTTYSTGVLVPREQTGEPTIGRPIHNTQAYVLDNQLEPVPIGVAGELYLGGDGVTQGYWQRPRLTAERYVPDPFSGRPSARLYRTGDRVKYSANRELIFLGRIDHQIKLHGYRIELGEIEAALSQHPNIGLHVVLARQDVPGDTRLVAYFVPQQRPAPTSDALRDYLRASLPDYMLPSHFIALDEMPLTPNGKINRSALPAPDTTRPQLAAAFVPPRSEIETTIAIIWADILQLDQVGVHDTFFDLGGHSLNATQVISRLRDTFNVDLPLRQLFAAPTVAGLSYLVEQVKGDAAATSLATLSPVFLIPRTNNLPLSFAQQRLWFLAQLEPDSAYYNIPAIFELAGTFNLSAFQRAIDGVVARHESLRTTFGTYQGKPIQIITPASSQPVRLLDWRELPGDEQSHKVHELTVEDAQTPFDLTKGPLLRVTVVRLADEKHLLLVNMHHIISDAWSIRVFIREMAFLYTAELQGKAIPLPPLTFQYVDFALWQRQILSGDQLETQLNYWQTQLAGVPPLLELPTDHPRPVIQSLRGATYEFVLPAELTANLRTFSRTQEATLFMTLLAAFATLLHRFSHQDDIVIGSPIANRNHSEIEPLIGFFVNTLVLRTRFQPEVSFAELLAQVRQTVLAAFEHQDLPFELLVDRLQPERTLSHTPLFQVAFDMQVRDAAAPTLPNLSITSHATPVTFAKFDMHLSFHDHGSTLTGHWDYNADLFDPATIERMAACLHVLLADAVTRPETTVSRLPLLSKEAYRQLVVEWNQTQRKYPTNKSIAALFEEQAARWPQTIAVVMADNPDKALTYHQLNERANRLAHYLIAQGVGPETLVGVCAERSLDLIVSLLAIIKAGGAYIPFDPAYPAERLRFMLGETEVKWLLAQTKLAAQLPPHEAHLFNLDTDWEHLAQFPPTNPQTAAHLDNLAYIMYTSGSTGRPKGVSIPQRGIVRLVQNSDFMQLGPEEVFLQFAPIAFDAATLEIWGPLLNGGRLVIMPPHSPSLAELGQALTDHGVTALWLTASLFNLMIDERPADLRAVRQLLAGGETLSVTHVRQALAQLLPGHTLINGYGPTENTTFTCCYPMTSDSVLEGTVPIGRPIANTTVYLLDEQRQPVPIGVAGELYTGGDGIARGYYKRPELSAERFVDNPFGSGKLYRTGDLARYWPDGQIEFLGRNDLQVKIRGYRIELGEIEAALGQHRNVGLHAVLAREDTPGQKVIVGYLAPLTLPAPTPDELRQHLRQTLPDYMIPTHFVIMDELPLNPNGKIDRRRLPPPDLERTVAILVAPRNETEHKIAAIWQGILRLDTVSIHDNFFELGGHSLTATQVVAHLREAFNIELSLRQLFEQPTIAGLALLIDQAQQAEASDIPLRSVPRDEALALSFAQQRLWFLDQLEPNSPFYNAPVAFEVKGLLDVDAFQAALAGLVNRHESLRTTFSAEEGRPVQKIHSTMAAPLNRFDWRSLPLEERQARLETALREEAQRPFDLERGPLWRGDIFQLADDRYVLLLNMHHIISDGWSLGVFIREMAALYMGQAEQLPVLPIQYADFAVWQRQWLQGELLERQLDYWRQQLAQAPGALALPTDRPRPPVQSYHGATHRFVLTPALTSRLEQLSQQAGVTMFMTLLAAFQTLLYRYSGQTDIVVGTPIANRTRRETEGLIGFFVNTLALRTQLSADMAFLTLLRQVRETTLAAYAHQDLPFERLVEAIQLTRDLSRTPLFQTVFSWQNIALVPEITTDELTLRPLDIESGIAKFDLTLTMRPTSNGIVANLEYNTDLFEAATVVRLSEHLISLLEVVTLEPKQPIGRISYLQAAERAQLLHTWNDTNVVYDLPGATLQALFEVQAARTPEATAVIFGSERLTYRELNSRANQLARFLQQQGIGSDQLVGVCMHRSLEMVVALYGIIKAGAAYVPLDPTYPPERLAFMLTDAAAPVLLTQAELVASLPEYAAATICLDSDWHLIAGENDGNLDVTLTGQNLAYMIYTSGSTGRPKGAMNSHEAIRNRLLWMQAEYQLDQNDRILQKTPFSFDVSVWEFFWPLMTGAALVVAKPEGHKDNHYLVDTIIEQEITTLHFVPSMLQLFVETDGIERCISLKRVICSGEALPYDLQQRFFKRLPAVELHNLYGPTEAAIDVTYWACWPDDPRPLVPIGRPIANTQIYVLDDQLNPVPMGITGELHIGGVNLARGYWQRAALTAEKFIPDPFSSEPGARLYKTGDAVRWLPDGVIDYIGRIDFQVKLRGFRIELGEIEAALTQHEAVQEAVVLVREVAGDPRLVAYVVPDQEHAAALRRLLQWENSAEISAYEQYELPTGHTILHQNANEVAFVYEEIFIQQTYLQHGIILPPDACVFDVGANLGLFTLFAATVAPKATLYAFEPLPPIFDLLARNSELAGLNVHLYQCGLAAEPGEATFTYYPHASIISGRFADSAEEQAVVKSFLQQQQTAQRELTDTMIEELLAERLNSVPYLCSLRPLSDIIAETGVTKIDLLKIDVEKSEADVLAGICEADWPKICQIVVEVHDLDGRLEAMVDLLRNKGFVVTTAEETTLQQSGLYNVYAVRPDAAATQPPDDSHEPVTTWHSRGRLIETLRHTLEKQLPDYMIPSSFVFLEAMPLTPNGKVDRRALPEPTGYRQRTEEYVAPRDDVEAQLAAIWETVLGPVSVGVTDDFFKLGGHSLLAVQLVARIEKIFGRRLPLALLFQKPAVAQIAALLQQPELDAVPLPLVRLRAGSGRPLFWIHPGSGHVAGYQPLVQILATERPIYGLQADGLYGEKTALTSIEALATNYVTAIQKIQPDGPYWIGGWSLGGVIAFEIAQQLQASGATVERLLLLDTHPKPALPQIEAMPDEILNLLSFAQDLGVSWQAALPQIVGADEPLKRIFEIVAGESAGFDFGYFERLYTVFKANFIAWQNYQPKLYEGDAVLVAAAEKWPGDETTEVSYGWPSYLKGNFELIAVPGNHYTMMREPQVQILAQQVDAAAGK